MDSGRGETWAVAGMPVVSRAEEGTRGEGWVSGTDSGSGELKERFWSS